MKKSFYYLLLVLVIIILGIFVMVKVKNNSANPINIVAVNFNETGHLVKDNPGMKPGVWFLIYEKPGAPALSAELVFSEKSSCTYNGQSGACPDVLLPSSALTKIEGREELGVVKVISATSGN